MDYEHMNLARGYANDNIQELWYLVKADYRQSSDSLVTVPGSEQYVLNKHFDKFVPNSFRGPSSNPRCMVYKDPIEFFRYTRNYQNSQGVPYIYTFGDFSGVDEQLNADSRLEVYSSFSSKTSGTVKVIDGSRLITCTNPIFSITDVGLNFQRSGESTIYKIGEYISSTQVNLTDVYRGPSASGVSYKVGDIGQHVCIQGYVGGQVDSEDVILDGSNAVQTSKTFGVLTSVTKSDRTGGKVVVRNLANTQNVAIFAPAELVIERQSILVWRTPGSSETLPYRFYMKHPRLWTDTDRIFLPEKFYRLICYMTEADLRGWAGMSLPDALTSKIERGLMTFKADADDASLWRTIPNEEGFETGFGIIDGTKILDVDFAP